MKCLTLGGGEIYNLSNEIPKLFYFEKGLTEHVSK